MGKSGEVLAAAIKTSSGLSGGGGGDGGEGGWRRWIYRVGTAVEGLTREGKVYVLHAHVFPFTVLLLRLRLFELGNS